MKSLLITIGAVTFAELLVIAAAYPSETVEPTPATIFEEVLPLDIPDEIDEVVEIDEADNLISDEELRLLCACVHAEAGNQSELGRKLVCDVILNRVDCPDFPDTVTDVIMQKGQFDVVASGAINKDFGFSTYCLVVEELSCRTNQAVLFFRTGNYHKGTTPIIKEGDHYFSTKGE